MAMKSDILDSLEDLGYTGTLYDEGEFEAAIEEGPRSVEYTKLVEWLARDICSFLKLDEAVNAIKSPEECDNFMLELSGFLREFGCPYRSLTDGALGDRLSSRQKKLQLLDYLTTELEAIRMTAVNYPEKLSPAMQVDVKTENEVASCMKQMLISLGFPKPPANVTPFQLFSKLEAKLREMLAKRPIEKPLLKTRLSENQWNKIVSMNEVMTQEYGTRRNMLLKRLDVTIQSFMWSDKAQKNEDQIVAVYQPLRKHLSLHPKISEYHVLAAREEGSNECLICFKMKSLRKLIRFLSKRTYET